MNYNPDPAYPDNANINDFAGPWEDLTNYYGKKVDIFETELTDAQLSNSTYYVVSNGYIWNEVGQYATDWIIYEKNNSGSLVKKYRFCSESRRLEALDSNGNLTGSYTSLDYLQGHPIKITYEFSNLSGFHDGERMNSPICLAFMMEKDTKTLSVQIQAVTHMMVSHPTAATADGLTQRRGRLRLTLSSSMLTTRDRHLQGITSSQIIMTLPREKITNPNRTQV